MTPMVFVGEPPPECLGVAIATQRPVRIIETERGQVDETTAMRDEVLLIRAWLITPSEALAAYRYWSGQAD